MKNLFERCEQIFYKRSESETRRGNFTLWRKISLGVVADVSRMGLWWPEC